MKRLAILFLVMVFLSQNSYVFAQWQTNGSGIHYNDGYVGIGTDDPIKPLDIYGGIHDTPLIIRSNDATAYIGFMDPNTSHHQNAQIGAIGNDLSLKAGNNEVIRIRENGDVVLKDNNALILTSPDGTEWEITVDNSGNLSVNQSTKVNEIRSNYGINIYPNPTSDYIDISITSDEINSFDVEMYNIQGKLLCMKNYRDNNIRFDIKDYVTGLYMLKIQDEFGNIIKTEKIIKQ